MNCDKNLNPTDDGSIIWPCCFDVSLQLTGSLTQRSGFLWWEVSRCLIAMDLSISSNEIWHNSALSPSIRAKKHLTQSIFVSNQRSSGFFSFLRPSRSKALGSWFRLSETNSDDTTGDWRNETNDRSRICLKRDRKRLSFFSTCIRQRLTMKKEFGGEETSPSTSMLLMKFLFIRLISSTVIFFKQRISHDKRALRSLRRGSSWFQPDELSKKC